VSDDDDEQEKSEESALTWGVDGGDTEGFLDGTVEGLAVRDRVANEVVTDGTRRDRLATASCWDTNMVFQFSLTPVRGLSKEE
jgi:hypothetical protein